MIGLLLIGGLSRSLQFTAVTSLAYAEIPHNLMSRATSFSAMMQQFAQSFGVSLAALIAHFSIIASGRSSLTISDIMPAYFAIGIAAILSTAFFSRLSAHIGEDMGGGHRRKV
jgi:cytosine/uracil/thiamine/allantoin permease